MTFRHRADERYPVIYEYYAMVLEYEEDEDGYGMYYVADNQDYTLTVNPEGSLSSEDPSLMVGACMWVDNSANGGESGWGWIALGDTYDTFSPFTAEVEPAPADVAFEEWTFAYGPSAMSVEVGFKDDRFYLRGFAADFPDIAESAVVGTVNDGKVTFKSGQYLGVIEDYRTTAYFVAGNVSVVEDEWGPYEVIEYADEVTFDYSVEDELMTSDGAFCISSAADKALYYDMFNEIAFKKPVPDAKITALRQPVLYAFYEAMPEFEMDADLMFYLPMTDADYNLLDTEKYFWNLLVDDDVYVFASDEYPGLEEMFGGYYEMEDVPFAFNDGDLFWGWNGLNDVYLFMEGYETMAVRGVYKDGDNVIYSPLLYVVGDASGVKDVEAVDVVSSSYIDLQGRQVSNPAQGLFIRADKMDDGTMRYVKVVRR